MIPLLFHVFTVLGLENDLQERCDLWSFDQFVGTQQWMASFFVSWCFRQFPRITQRLVCLLYSLYCFSSNFVPPANVEYQLASIIIFSKYSRSAAINSRSSAILLFTSYFILFALFQFSNVNCIIACVDCRGLLAGSHALCTAHVQQQAAVNIHTPEHALVFFVIIFVYIYMDTYDFTIYHTWFLYLYISRGSLCFKWMF